MLGKLAWFLEAGSSKLKRQKLLQKTAEMIIKGDLDRMAEEIGHPGNVSIPAF